MALPTVEEIRAAAGRLGVRLTTDSFCRIVGDHGVCLCPIGCVMVDRRVVAIDEIRSFYARWGKILERINASLDVSSRETTAFIKGYDGARPSSIEDLHGNRVDLDRCRKAFSLGREAREALSDLIVS